MLRIITLLNQKNHYLEKFYSVNETELLNFSQGNFDQLDRFYNDREDLLKIIKYIDAELEQAQAELREMTSVEEKRQAREAMAIKDEYVSRILSQDLEILSCIESAKSSIIRELQDMRRTRKVMGHYKSPNFHNRLDEEA